jgi:GDP-L-fucose synthase
MKNALLLGGTSFLGGHLAAALRQRDWEVVSTGSRDFDLRNYDVPETLKSPKFSLIVLLSAWTQAGTFCDTHRGEQWLINQGINTNALRYWHEYQPQAKLVAFGTSVSYDETLGFREETYLEGVPHDKYAAYAWSKRSLLVGLQSLAKQFGYQYLYLIPSTLVGPNYHLDGRQLHFIYDIVRKCLRSQLDGGDVILWGDGHQRRELVDVRDAAEWILELAETVSDPIVNLGAGKDYSIRELAGMVCKIIDLPPERLKFDETAFVGVRAKILDISRLNILLPHRRQTPVEETLGSVIEWAKEKGLLQNLASTVN